MTPISGGYLKLGARGKNSQKLVFLKTKEGFDLALCNFSPKIIMIFKKKGLHFESIFFLRIFLPQSCRSLKKKRCSLRIKLRVIYFRHQLQVFSKKKSPHSESSFNLSIFVPKFSDFPITCAISIIFSKSSAALLEFSKFCGTKHKMPICFAIPKLF